MLKRPRWSMMDIDNLDVYYEDCVIGGPGAFVIPIREREKFKEAIHHKLVQEIASVVPQPKVMPVFGRKAAHRLHHRREAVAAALGRLTRIHRSQSTLARRSPHAVNSGTDRPA